MTALEPRLGTGRCGESVRQAVDVTGHLHEIYVAISRSAEAPRIDHPPVRIFWFAGNTFSEGIDVHRLDGVPVRIYNRAKTLA